MDEAQAPTLWDFDKNGYASPSNDRLISAQEKAQMDSYNDSRRKMNDETRRTLDDFLDNLFPLTWSPPVISPIHPS